VLVDIQNDFCPGGALAVPGGDRVVGVVNSLAPIFRLVVASQDWHPAGHVSFETRGGPWPPHCIQGTRGADFHPELDQSSLGGVVRKAANPDRDAYSAFDGYDNESRTLDQILRSHGIEEIYVAGLATDYCVRATALEGIEKGYRVAVVVDAVRAVDASPGDGERALGEIERRGGRLVTSRQLGPSQNE
jgi:nicotinamidase/pyrazinamidase